MNTPTKYNCDPIKLGCKLVESGEAFETALGALLEAESNKINALVKAFSPEDSCYPVCNDDLLNANSYLSQSLDCIKEIESLVLKIINLGNTAMQTPNPCPQTTEEITTEKKELIEEAVKIADNFDIEDLQSLVKRFLNQ